MILKIILTAKLLKRKADHLEAYTDRSDDHGLRRPQVARAALVASIARSGHSRRKPLRLDLLTLHSHCGTHEIESAGAAPESLSIARTLDPGLEMIDLGPTSTLAMTAIATSEQIDE